jgi:aspartate kinase
VQVEGLHVLKFGGTSLKSIARIQHVAQIIAQATKNGPVLVVVSAMGDTTDYLMKLARQCSPNPNKRELDLLLATGEQISVSLLAMTLHAMNITARSLTAAQVGIFTEDVHNNARIVEIKTYTLAEALDTNKVVIVAGFQGVTEQGEVTTLGRGGSDITAVAMAGATGTRICDIYTDVDGVFTSDPEIVPQARLLEKISYDQIVEMARLGARVIHPRAVDLARQYGITLRIRNTFKPDFLGTTIVGEEDMEIARSVSGVAIDQEQAGVAIVDVPDRPGIAGTIMTALAKRNIVTDMIMQACHPVHGLNTITFTVNSGDLRQTLDTLEELKSSLGAKQVISDSDIAKVSLIGTNLGGQPSIIATLFNELGKNNVNIKMISTGERKLTCVVSKKDAERAARLAHEAFALSS